MSIGVIDLLCAIPHAEFVKYGIPFVRSLIEDGLDKNDIERRDHFWAYFIRQWVNKTGIHKWSIVDYTTFVAAQKKLEKKEEAKKKRVAAKKVTQAVAAKKQAKKR